MSSKLDLSISKSIFLCFKCKRLVSIRPPVLLLLTLKLLVTLVTLPPMCLPTAHHRAAPRNWRDRVWRTRLPCFRPAAAVLSPTATRSRWTCPTGPSLPAGTTWPAIDPTGDWGLVDLSSILIIFICSSSGYSIVSSSTLCILYASDGSTTHYHDIWLAGHIYSKLATTVRSIDYRLKINNETFM